MKEVNFKDNTIHLKVHSEEGVSYKIQFIGAENNSFNSKVLETVDGTEAKFKIHEDLLFVRAKVISDKAKKNPYQEGDVEVAWIQPFLPGKN